MKITIITVAYNSAETIGDTLRSVAEQTHGDVEHIVIDGGSTDGTMEVVRREGLHVSIVVSEPDQGIYDAMNKGMRLASGEFLGFLNADDMLASANVVQKIAEAGIDPVVGYVYGDLVYVRKDATTEVTRHWRAGTFTTGKLKFGWMPPHPTFYVRRSVAQRVGGFDVNFRVAADYDFMLRCLRGQSHQAAYLPDVLVRMRTGGVSNRSLPSLMLKSSEDLAVLRKNDAGGLATILCKNVRKLPQFLR
jgi:glycosyltransferase